MRAFLAAVLSVIAVGVLLVAYALLTPRAPMAGTAGYVRAIPASERIQLVDDPYTITRPGLTHPAGTVQMMPAAPPSYVTRPIVRPRPSVEPTARRVAVERSNRRDWKKTALLIGGSSAAGAGLGAIFGGKKGALIGAAIAGGAGTLYEVTKR